MVKTPDRIKYTKGDVTIETSDVGEGVRLRAEGFKQEKPTAKQSSSGSSTQGRSQS